MTERISIELPGFGHANPIPVASRIGPFLASGALTGRDPASGVLPTGLDQQVVNVFAHVRALVRAVDASTDSILKMTFHLADPRDRETLNREWLAMFPDPAHRPARQVIAARLDGRALVHCDLLAVLPEPSPSTSTPPAA
ncbi:RidA family protein [Streptomyces sp. NPDC059785]|uniref:RidA family protein n=1 Tax=Streptomyces sp. NPDC059785 TaxID=3346945 RepID=UPI003665C2BF